MKNIKKKVSRNIVYLQCVLLPNGEVIFSGKTIGFFKSLEKIIYIKKNEER